MGSRYNKRFLKLASGKTLVMALASVIILSGAPKQVFGSDIKATPTLYQAEDATLMGGVKAYEDDVCSKGHYVEGFFDNKEGAISFKITAEKDGDYSVGIRYANGFAGVKMYINANEDKPGEVDFDTTGDWEKYSDKSVILHLNKGDNKISITNKDKTTGVCIDYISTLPKEAVEVAPAVTGDKYEAEKATLEGKLGAVKDPVASGEYEVEGFSTNKEGKLTFKVNAPKSGDYKITVRYTNGNEDCKMYIRLNKGKAEAWSFPTTYGYNTYADMEKVVSLKQGENLITFSNDDADVGINFDYILVEAK